MIEINSRVFINCNIDLVFPCDNKRYISVILDPWRVIVCKRYILQPNVIVKYRFGH